MDQNVPYEQRRNPNLPWGYWLVATGEADRWPPLMDDEGRRWSSLRQALWVGRLGMAEFGPAEAMHKELELLLAVLVAIDRRVIHTEETVIDLLGSWDRSRHYAAWLQGQKLVNPDPGASLSSGVSPEGRAVLTMLASTRRAKDAPLPIGLPTLRQWHGLNDPSMDEETRETILAAQERVAAHLRFRFIREELGGSPALVLLGDGLGPNVPIRRKLWSLTLPDAHARDRLYMWLHDRIDRWNGWGELAYHRGARALSENLLQLRFADERIVMP